ncbi:hypothetical protein [Moorella sp. E306M]|uniref:hypothetical protein n=1 Tax=Moorella sp. E306M TaxID=2572683 RepID=UPI00209C5264|nr:hypothetical protein [Moorella sp. E306M]
MVPSGHRKGDKPVALAGVHRAGVEHLVQRFRGTIGPKVIRVGRRDHLHKVGSWWERLFHGAGGPEVWFEVSREGVTAVKDAVLDLVGGVGYFDAARVNAPVGPHTAGWMLPGVGLHGVNQRGAAVVIQPVEVDGYVGDARFVVLSHRVAGVEFVAHRRVINDSRDAPMEFVVGCSQKSVRSR